MGDILIISGRSLGRRLLALAGSPARRWALVPLAGGVFMVLSLAGTGTVAAPTIAAALADPLSILSARSPGARPDGALTQSKLRRVPTPEPRKPDFISLIDRPLPDRPIDGDLNPQPDTMIALIDAIVPEPIAAITTFVPEVTVVPDVPIPPRTIVPPTPPQVVPGAIPEPATWITLMLGFGLVGGVLRRRHREAVTAQA